MLSRNGNFVIATNTATKLQLLYTWILTATPIMNQASDYIGYLHLLWREDMKLNALDTMDGDKQLYTNPDLRPTNSPAYRDGGKYDLDAWELPLWRLDPYLFKRVMVRGHTELGALTSYEVLQSITELITLRRNILHE